MRTCMLLCAFVVCIYRGFFLYDAVYIILASERGGVYYQASEKQCTESTVKMCVLICLIVVRKHDKILLIHCSDIALKRLHRP